MAYSIRKPHSSVIPNTICYVTKKLDTSVAILESPEDELVLEALMYLSEFVNVYEENLNYLQSCGAVNKLLNLLDRDVPIQKLALRLLGMLLTVDEAMEEIDQEQYDTKILKISELYITDKNDIVKQFCMSVLSKLASKDRIVCLIFKMELFCHILHTVQTTRQEHILEWNLDLFLKLLSVPAALDILPDIYGIDLSVLMKDLNNSNKNIVCLIFEIIYELTYYCVDSIQKTFRQATLLETMFDVVTDPTKEEYHETAFHIIINSMKSYETSDYFIESLQFLKFCQWAKTCEEIHHDYCISILEQLTAIPSRRQILFDLSVEESIISFFRSTEKSILNKTCTAVTNMLTHKYCCEQMLKPAVLKEIFQILLRKDEEDPANEIALRAIVAFSRKSFTTFDLIYKFGVHRILLGYFKRDECFMSEESWIGIMEILNEMSVHPIHQQDIIGIGFLQKLLRVFQTPTNTATFASEVMANLVAYPEFRRIFLSLNGPKVYTEALRQPQDMKLLRNAFHLIYVTLMHEDIVKKFLQNGLIQILKDFPEHLKFQIPVAEKILRLIYDQNPSIKFFHTNRLNVTDKLGDTFYMIIGQWKADLPSPEDLEKRPTSANCTAYVVNYSFDLKHDEDEDTDASTPPTSTASETTLSVITKNSSSLSSHVRRACYQISYGKLSCDPFLPMYIETFTKHLHEIEVIEERIELLAQYVDSIFHGAVDGYVKADQVHGVKLHVELLKHELGTNLVPIGFLRVGDHCERAVLFKAIADRCCIPTSLVKGKSKLYWNEVILFDREAGDNTLRMYVVDLMDHVGKLLPAKSRVANHYCNIETCVDKVVEHRSSKDVTV